MSTRSTVHFTYGKRTEAIVYRHSDGYPEGAGADLFNFLDELKANVADTRITDPTYLAAKYVVWLANEFAQLAKKYDHCGPYHPLNFLSVGVCLRDPGDIEYRYFVDSSRIDSGLPHITYEEIKYSGKGWNKQGELTRKRCEQQGVTCVS